MNVCIVYDCLYPWTIGGAERWCRGLAEALADEGHSVTYLTLRQWPVAEAPRIPGVRVVGFGPRATLYRSSGRRRVGPPVRFGAAVLAHLLRHGREYDVVHAASFPYFSVLAAGAARPFGRYRLVVDWHEFWTRPYWEGYLGPRGGALAWWLQRWCVAVPHIAFCFSEMTAARLRAVGRGDVTVLRGMLGELQRGDHTTSVRGRPGPADAGVVFAGRFVPEKQIPRLVEAVMLARRSIPNLTLDLYGEGPDRARVAAAIAEHDVHDAVTLHARVPPEILAAAIAAAGCVASASTREGYGALVAEAIAVGTPAVVVAAADNAAVELVEPGVNGAIAASDLPVDIADAIVTALRGGAALRATTAAWFAAHLEELSLETSLARVRLAYGALP